MPRPHWPPRTGDLFFDATRERQRLIAYGKIVRTERDWSAGYGEGTATVKFPGRRVRFEKHRFTIDGQSTWKMFIRVNGILHNSLTFEDPDDYKPHQDAYRTYEFYELDGNWSSSEDGDGSWSIE